MNIGKYQSNYETGLLNKNPEFTKLCASLYVAKQTNKTFLKFDRAIKKYIIKELLK